MQKVLELKKLWKVLSFGVAAAALGMMMASCAETGDPVDEDETFNVTLVGGGTGAKVTDYDLVSKTSFYAGDTVVINAGVKVGFEFDGWTVTSGVNLLDPDTTVTTFIMPSKNVTVTANWTEEEGEVYYDGATQVRFSWPKAAYDSLGYDVFISAHKDAVALWKTDVYEAGLADGSYSAEDASDIPLYPGSTELPSLFFNSNNPTTAVNKSKYFDIADGEYTAVCTVEDEYGFFDIVANYEIIAKPATATADGADWWFEVVFDIVDYIEYYNDPDPENPDLGWYGDDYNNGNTPPKLEKKISRVKKFQSKKVTSAGTFEVTYYVLHRAKKA